MKVTFTFNVVDSLGGCLARTHLKTELDPSIRRNAADAPSNRQLAAGRAPGGHRGRGRAAARLPGGGPRQGAANPLAIRREAAVLAGQRPRIGGRAADADRLPRGDDAGGRGVPGPAAGRRLPAGGAHAHARHGRAAQPRPSRDRHPQAPAAGRALGRDGEPDEELAYGLRSVAAPIIGPDGRVPAGVNLAVQARDWSPERIVRELRPAVLATCAEISGLLTGP